MGIAARERVRFAEAPAVHDLQVWGVWDRRERCWAEKPGYCREAAIRIAAAMAEAYSAGSAEATAAGAHRGLPFCPSPHRDAEFVSWGGPRLFGFGARNYRRCRVQ
jgi:hypothetical protein